jgi:hypothetical protein
MSMLYMFYFLNIIPMPSEVLSYPEEYDLVVHQGRGLGQLFETKAIE